MLEDLELWRDQAASYAEHLLRDRPLLWNGGTQILVIAASLIVLRLFGPGLRRRLIAQSSRWSSGPLLQILAAGARIAPWALILLVFWCAKLTFNATGHHAKILHLAENLALAWIIIRFTSGLVRNPRIASVIAVAAWVFAALNIVGWIEPAFDLLDSAGIMIGHFRLSVLIVLKGMTLMVVLLWLASLSSRLLDARLQNFPTMTPAMQVLASKLAKVILLTLAVVIALNSVGIDLTAFAVFSGAIGVGVGFGLQKVVSNLISGVILLLDRSIKPGDVIEIAGTYGWITRLNARFVSVSTRDGIEHLIPNEDLITQRVTNWSYTNDLVRLHVPVGVDYSCDLRVAMTLCIEATKSVKRVLETPAPICLIKGFGDNSIGLELRFWIRDPRNGTANIRSEVMLNLWQIFRDNGIQMPFPQRQIHFSDVEGLTEKIRAATGIGERTKEDDRPAAPPA